VRQKPGRHGVALALGCRPVPSARPSAARQAWPQTVEGGAPAIARTTPVLLALFSLVTLVALRLRQGGPIPVQATAWYHQAEPTFADGLALVRRHLWCTRYLVNSAEEADGVQLPREAVDLLIHGFPLAARLAKVQSNEASRNEIDHFREGLHQHFTTYDPVTIDERPLQALLRSQPEEQHLEGKPVMLASGDRWRISADRILSGQGPQEIPIFVLDEMKEIAKAPLGEKTEFDRTIEARDLRLIDQADCLTVYRPQYHRGEVSNGTSAEIRYARRTQKPVFVVHDKKADGPLNPEVFDIEFRQSRYRFDAITDLADPSNQARVIEDLVHRLQSMASMLVSKRRSIK
jgi:hypothetical protein